MVRDFAGRGRHTTNGSRLGVNIPPNSAAPLATVVLLCFNYERFVDEALDGLFAQTYQPLDIIILDDCSSDQSAKIIEARLAQRGNPPNIRFVRNQRNMVHPIPGILGMIKGDFVVLASADDVMLPHMVERLVQTWMEQKVSLVTANAFYIDDASNFLNRTFRALGLPADDSFETLARDGTNACCFGAAMGFERAIYETFGWPPTEFLECSDIILPFYAYLLGGARFIHEPLLKYRVHSRNSSLSLKGEKTTGEAQLLALDRSLRNHLAHAIFFDEELDRIRGISPQRYAALANRIQPLVGTQITEMGRKLTRSRRELSQLHQPNRISSDEGEASLGH
jgi:glycosyltransferase involved in cell wall biosynthesis